MAVLTLCSLKQHQQQQPASQQHQFGMLSTSLPLDSIWGPNCIICWVDILLDSKRATTIILATTTIHTHGPDHLLSMIDIIDLNSTLLKKLWRSKPWLFATQIVGTHSFNLFNNVDADDQTHMKGWVWWVELEDQPGTFDGWTENAKKSIVGSR